MRLKCSQTTPIKEPCLKTVFNETGYGDSNFKPECRSLNTICDPMIKSDQTTILKQ